MTDFEQIDGEENVEKEEKNEVTENSAAEEQKPETPQTYGVSYTPAEHGTYNNTFYGGTYQPPRREEPKNEKKGNGGKIAAIAIIAVACVLFSFLAGALGSYVVGIVSTPAETKTPANNASVRDDFRPDGEVVIRYNEVDGNSYATPFTDVVASVKDSVVEVYTESVMYYGRSQYIKSGAGSGVIFSHDNSHYYIVTNNHVIEGANEISIRLADGSEYNAKLYAGDALSDLAIIVLDVEEGTTLTEARLAQVNGELLDGQDVFIIGNQLGLLGGSIGKGVIGKTERLINMEGIKMKLIQLDITVNPGNSGGGLFDMAGNLIGIVNGKSSGDTIEGLGYAIPISTVKSVCADLLSQKYVSGRVSIGVELEDFTLNSSIFSTETYPAIAADTNVTGIENGSSFAFEKGDIIYSINGTQVSSAIELENILNLNYNIGDTVELVVYRAQKQGYTTRYVDHTVTVTLVEYTK